MEADQDKDGKISFDEFTKLVENTDVSMSMTLGTSDLCIPYYLSSSRAGLSEWARVGPARLRRIRRVSSITCWHEPLETQSRLPPRPTYLANSPTDQF